MDTLKVFITTFLLLISLCLKSQTYPFQNPDLPIEQRVNDLVSRLSLDEKVNQMLNKAPAIERLGIPEYDWWNECLHGIGRTEYKVTVFPQAIGMAASWDPTLMKNVADAIAEEGRAINNDALAKGNHAIYHGLTYWTPNINIFRDPRWGRGQETYGEDPYLTATIGKAFVEGLQGNDPHYLKAAACAKHYAVHSGPENTRHTFNTVVSPYDLWDTYLPAFKALVTDAHVEGVMCAYNAYEGQPCCGNNFLMQDILRKQWGFEGYVTSDCGAIDDFFRHHKTHINAEYAAADAVINGTDLECGQAAYKALTDAVASGFISEKQIDESVKKLFTTRFKLGLFDPADKVKYASIPLSVLESDAHKKLASEITRKSIVLLKNEGGLLPLSKKLKKIAVIGPNADNETTVLGNYNGFPSTISTPYKAIKNKLKNTEVIYEKGIDYVEAIDSSSAQKITNLIERVKGVDAVIFVGGISPELEGEEMNVNVEGFSGGDRTSIVLPKIQTNVLQALYAEKIPVVFVMTTGSAIATPWESEHIPAIINAWYSGQDAGNGIADIIFGDYNPSGKLPVTFYASDKDLPPFNSYTMKNRTYRYFSGQTLYPFGYGLSYTQFEYSPIDMPEEIQTDVPVEISVTIKNAGNRDGDEVVQLYISHTDAPAPKPLYALKAFERVSLKAGESRKVTFTLQPDNLTSVDHNGIAKLYPGKKKIYVGSSSPSYTSAQQLPIVEKEFRVTK
ncbi:MAG: glycoside hydrolase family 3 C-terminal domain-containing protein [Dysgonomonas sp.]